MGSKGGDGYEACYLIKARCKTSSRYLKQIKPKNNFIRIASVAVKGECKKFVLV